MNKKILRFVVIFWGISALFLLSYLVYDFFKYGMGSYWLFGHSAGIVEAFAWVDSNANLRRDAGDHPLANVCIWYGTDPQDVFQDEKYCQSENHFSTDEQGKWSGFLPVGMCDEVYVFAKAPDGFKSIGGSELDASNGCHATFVFVPKDTRINWIIDRFFRPRVLAVRFTSITISLITITICVAGIIWLQKRYKAF